MKEKLEGGTVARAVAKGVAGNGDLVEIEGVTRGSKIVLTGNLNLAGPDILEKLAGGKNARFITGRGEELDLQVKRSKQYAISDLDFLFDFSGAKIRIIPPRNDEMPLDGSFDISIYDANGKGSLTFILSSSQGIMLQKILLAYFDAWNGLSKLEHMEKNGYLDQTKRA